VGEQMKLNNEFKKYIVDVCNYIDIMFSIVLVSVVIKGIFYTFTNNDWLIVGIASAGVLFWPNKKYIAKWLHVDWKNDGYNEMH
jgi:hypothetical protein